MAYANHGDRPILLRQGRCDPLELVDDLVARLQVIETEVIRGGHDEIPLLRKLFQQVAVRHVRRRTDNCPAEKVEQGAGLAEVRRRAEEVVSRHLLPSADASLDGLGRRCRRAGGGGLRLRSWLGSVSAGAIVSGRR